MATRVYGASDDLVEFEGDVSGEVGHFCGMDDYAGTLVVFSDGTLLNVKYGKNKMAIWEISAINDGELFEGIDPCTDEDADPYSDVATFRDGLKWAYAATKWERVS